MDLTFSVLYIICTDMIISAIVLLLSLGDTKAADCARNTDQQDCKPRLRLATATENIQKESSVMECQEALPWFVLLLQFRL